VADAVGERITLHVRNSIDAIGPAIDAATAWLNERHASATDVWFVALAVDELVSNCVKYAYEDAGNTSSTLNSKSSTVSSASRSSMTGTRSIR
jgi:anti-sigma regulatory factor (Ser/Thr protein kinase)